MKSTKKTVELFVANDGKEFLSKKDCERYEREVLDEKEYVKYFEVCYNPDLTETGCYTSRVQVAVYSFEGYHYSIVLNWCIEERDMKVLGKGVQGWGYLPNFDIVPISEKEYFTADCQKEFLSPKDIEGFPAKFNYMSKWNFR